MTQAANIAGPPFGFCGVRALVVDQQDIRRDLASTQAHRRGHCGAFPGPKHGRSRHQQDRKMPAEELRAMKLCNQ